MKVQKKSITFLLFILLSFLWGSSFPVIKIGLNYAPPILYVGFRCLLAGAVMIVIARVMEGKLQVFKVWSVFVI